MLDTILSNLSLKTGDLIVFAVPLENSLNRTEYVFDGRGGRVTSSTRKIKGICPRSRLSRSTVPSMMTCDPR